MSPGAQHDRNNPDGSLLGNILKTAAIAAAAYFGGSALISSFGSTAGAGAAAAADGAVSASTAAAFGSSADTLGYFATATDAAVNTSVADYIAAASAGLDVGATTAFTAGLPLASLAASSPGFLASAWQAAKTAQSVVSTASTVSKLVSGAPKIPQFIQPSQNAARGFFMPDSVSSFDASTGANMFDTSQAKASTPSMQTPFILPAENSAIPLPLFMAAGFAAILFLVKK
jgi:hypothetical protein